MNKRIKLSKKYITLNALGLLFLLLLLFIFLTLFLDIEHLYNFVSTKEELTLDAAVFIGVLIFQGILTLYLILRRMSEYYILDKSEIRHKTGIIASHIKIHKLEKIESIIVEQSIIQKLFNYGRIEMRSPLMEKTVVIENVDNPNSLLQEIEFLLKQEPEEEELIINKE